MPTDFDALRAAPLPDSFDRTADWLRSVPPPTPSPVRPLLLTIALAAVLGACAWPVTSGAVLGWVVEARTTDASALIAALDEAIAAEDRLTAEIEPADGAAAVRYVVLDADAARRAQAVAETRADEVRLTTLDADVREPLALAAARWVGVSAGPRLSDDALQDALDRAFAGHPRLAPRVGRDPDGRRVLALGDHVRLVLHPETRVARSGDAVSLRGGDLSGFTIGGVPVARLLGSALADGARLDSLTGAAAAARVLSLDEAAAQLDSLGVSRDALRGLLGSAPGPDSVRSVLIRIPD